MEPYEPIDAGMWFALLFPFKIMMFLWSAPLPVALPLLVSLQYELTQEEHAWGANCTFSNRTVLL